MYMLLNNIQLIQLFNLGANYALTSIKERENQQNSQTSVFPYLYLCPVVDM